MNTLNNVHYFGLFFDDLSSNLERDVCRKHITFKYSPTSMSSEEVPMDCMWDFFKVKVIGYGNDGKNEGYLIELPKNLRHLYKGQDKIHITLSVQGKGKPVDTGKLSFQLLLFPFEIEGVMDVFQTV